MTGFRSETFAFLAGIAEHNEKAWFDANRNLYDVGYVEAGKAFVEAVGPELQKISPTVQYEPRIGASLMRVNSDTRFSRNKQPYTISISSSGIATERAGRNRASSCASPPGRCGAARACTISRAIC